MSRYLVAVFALAAAGFGQEIRTGAIAGGTASMPRAGTGMPYSAEEIDEEVRMLPDGTHVTRKLTFKVYRDSAGRTRREKSPDGTGGATSIAIFDPLTRVQYELNTQEKTARKLVYPLPEDRAVQRAPMAQPAAAETSTHTVEKLGKRIMEVLEVEGTRRTTTWPVGSVGNDQPITVVGEMWWSRELDGAVMSKRSDPRTGERTLKLTNINRVEPDASLFELPADYTVVEEQAGG